MKKLISKIRQVVKLGLEFDFFSWNFERLQRGAAVAFFKKLREQGYAYGVAVHTAASTYGLEDRYLLSVLENLK